MRNFLTFLFSMLLVQSAIAQSESISFGNTSSSLLHFTHPTGTSLQWLRFQYTNAAGSNDNAYIGIQSSTNQFVFNKSLGTVAGNTATSFQFYNCGGLNSDGFWNGVQFWGHTVTDATSSTIFPKFTFYSRSSTSTNPSVYDFNFELGNTGTIPGTLRYAVPLVNGSYISFQDKMFVVYNSADAKVGIGTSTPTSTLHVNGSLSRGAPVTVTAATHTVAETTSWIICNRAGAVTLTLPTASSFVGREIMVKTVQAQAVNSASANVVGIATTSAGTSILSGTAGAWATLVSDGTNWIIMQRGQ